jgi:hypothetical protein
MTTGLKGETQRRGIGRSKEYTRLRSPEAVVIDKFAK